MIIELSDIEARVLGALVEKQITTPAYYPMTLNGILNACNQKSNRIPVVSYSEKEVIKALDSLREKKLTWMLTSTGSRVPKYKHSLPEILELAEKELAIICGLLLRGPQTAGELRAKCARLFPFTIVAEVDQVLTTLLEREQPLIIKLPRQPGRKEHRFTHLLCGEPNITETPTIAGLEPARREVEAEQEKIQELSESVVALRDEVSDLSEKLLQLSEEFKEFRRQFE